MALLDNLRPRLVSLPLPPNEVLNPLLLSEIDIGALSTHGPLLHSFIAGRLLCNGPSGRLASAVRMGDYGMIDEAVC